MATWNAKVRLAGLAERQFGRVSRAQLRSLAISDATLDAWLEQGYLHRVLPRVYAVGHRAPGIEGDLAAALLYAGPDATLSHATAAWWAGLADSRPQRIDVRTPRRCRSLPGIKVHDRRPVERLWHKRLPVTPLAQTLLDYASVTTLTNVRRALAQADYDGSLDLVALEAVLQRGCRGSARLRRALREHQPRLASTRSGVEAAFFELCESARIPLPQLNVRLAGWTVDAVWRAERVVVELDGWGNHRTPAQIRRDRRKELELRAAGFLVLRYSYEQVTRHRRAVTDELRRLLQDRAQAA